MLQTFNKEGESKGARRYTKRNSKANKGTSIGFG
jgi:hypothetical protein